MTAAFGRTVAYCVLARALCFRPYNETPRSAWTVSEANHTVPSYTLKTSLQ